MKGTTVKEMAEERERPTVTRTEQKRTDVETCTAIESDLIGLLGAAADLPGNGKSTDDSGTRLDGYVAIGL